MAKFHAIGRRKTSSKEELEQLLATTLGKKVIIMSCIDYVTCFSCLRAYE